MTNNIPRPIIQFIESLTYDELHKLNHVVVERLKLLSRADSLMAMKDFHIDDLVMFEYQGERKMGHIVRLNPKTITVKLDNAEQWKIAPHYLQKIENIKAKNPTSSLTPFLKKMV